MYIIMYENFKKFLMKGVNLRSFKNSTVLKYFYFKHIKKKREIGEKKRGKEEAREKLVR